VLHTAGELVARYLEPLAQTAALRPHIRLGARVVGISRWVSTRPKPLVGLRRIFEVLVETADGVLEQHARAVIEASGTWGQPNPIGAHGLPAQGELQARDCISYGMPDILGAERHRFAGSKVLVAGAGHLFAASAGVVCRRARPGNPQTRDWRARRTGGGHNRVAA
jgi:hypothetical protein